MVLKHFIFFLQIFSEKGVLTPNLAFLNDKFPTRRSHSGNFPSDKNLTWGQLPPLHSPFRLTNTPQPTSYLVRICFVMMYDHKNSTDLAICNGVKHSQENKDDFVYVTLQ